MGGACRSATSCAAAVAIHAIATGGITKGAVVRELQRQQRMLLPQHTAMKMQDRNCPQEYTCCSGIMTCAQYYLAP